MHPRRFWYSPTRHQFCLDDVMDFCIVFSGISGEGSLWTRCLFCSMLFCKEDAVGSASSLASIRRFPTFCTTPSATSTVVFTVSAATSEVTLIACPVEYPIAAKKFGDKWIRDIDDGLNTIAEDIKHVNP